MTVKHDAKIGVKLTLPCYKVQDVHLFEKLIDTSPMEREKP